MKEIKIYQSPVDYQLIYQTPEGVMNEKEYLVWLGNILVEIKQALKG